MKINVRVGKIAIELGDKTVHLTEAEARELQTGLDDILGEASEFNGPFTVNPDSHTFTWGGDTLMEIPVRVTPGPSINLEIPTLPDFM